MRKFRKYHQEKMLIKINSKTYHGAKLKDARDQWKRKKSFINLANQECYKPTHVKQN